MSRAAAGLFSILLAASAAAQVVTPRGKVAAVYKDPGLESFIVSEVEANGRWRLDFSAAEIPARLPDESSPSALVRFLLPARDNGVSVLARVRGPGKKNEGWVDPEKIDISADPAWKIPSSTLLFVPMKARQVPPLRAAALPAGAGSKPVSFLLLVDLDGKVAGVRPLDASADPETENALRQFRFAPMRLEGEPVYVLLAVRVSRK